MSNKKERVAIFIDGSNLYHNMKRYNLHTKFEDLIKKIETKREVIDVFYYTALLEESINKEKYREHKQFLDKISRISNFHVVLCNLRKIVMLGNKKYAENRKRDTLQPYAHTWIQENIADYGKYVIHPKKMIEAQWNNGK